MDELLVNQTKLEQALYDIQREVGLALDEVFRLQEELARKERERLGGP